MTDANVDSLAEFNPLIDSLNKKFIFKMNSTFIYAKIKKNILLINVK
jgi:hypothetical protein